MTTSGLYTAAVFAAGAAPTDPAGYQAWLGRVAVIVSDLSRLVAADHDREARKTGEWYGDDSVVKSFRAHLVAVDTLTRGEGDHQVTKGVLTLEARGSTNPDSEGHETIETALLNTEHGADEFARAQALVGQNVIIWKRNFAHPTDKTKKLKELVAVDPAGGAVGQPAATATVAPVTAHPNPVPSETSTVPTAEPAAVTDPVATAAAAQAAIKERTGHTVDEPSTVPAATSAAAPVLTAAEVTVDSIESLLVAAEQHLGMSAAEVHAAVEARYGKVPEGRRLPARQYTNLWNELAGQHRN